MEVKSRISCPGVVPGQEIFVYNELWAFLILVGVQRKNPTRRKFRVGLLFISLFPELRHGGEAENIELLGCVFSEHSEMLALPVFYLLGCQRRADSAAGFHPAVPALAREMHLQLPLLVVHELELFFVAGGYFYRVHRLARAAPVGAVFEHEILAHAGNLVFKRHRVIADAHALRELLCLLYLFGGYVCPRPFCAEAVHVTAAKRPCRDRARSAPVERLAVVDSLVFYIVF